MKGPALRKRPIYLKGHEAAVAWANWTKRRTRERKYALRSENAKWKRLSGKRKQRAKDRLVTEFLSARLKTYMETVEPPYFFAWPIL